MIPAASIVLPTRNRRECLLTAIEAAFAQTVPVEVIVMDDGSTDGSAAAVRERFPAVRYYQLAEGRGPAFQRNRGTELATAPIVFPLDDDAVLVSPRTVEQTLAEFDDPRVGAVGIPFINVRKDETLVLQRAPAGGDDEVYLCHAFVGASHALRRDVFLKLGGYREHLFYMGEEGDYCIRMLDAGYLTRVGRADPLHHHESPHRALWRADYYGRRNDVLFAWQNAPAPDLPAQALGTVVKGAWFGFKVGRPWHMLRGIASGCLACVGGQVARQPVSRDAYRLHRRLKRGGIVPASQIG